MDIKELTAHNKPRPGLLGVEKISIAYTLFTAVVATIFNNEISGFGSMMLSRVAILAGIAVLFAIYRLRACRLTFFLRNVYQLALLAYWYPETYQFCSLFPNLDYIFAAAEQSMFECQPALLLSEWLDGKAWSEAFNLGYFSYYPMIFFVVLWTFFKHYRYFEKTTFIIVCSFFIYYLIYIFVPVAGPQYYYQAVGLDSIRAGIFPELGDYFRYHVEMLPTTHTGGVFQSLVEAAQEGGERPTAAFPSSHVGISTILLILTFKVRHKTVLLLLPFYVLLCFATVYIQAHYAVDSIAGLLSAFFVYVAARLLYKTRTLHRKHGFHC